MSVWNFTIYKSSRQASFYSWILKERSQDDCAKKTIRRKRRKNHRNWDWASSSIQRASVSSERSVWVTTSAWYPGNICFASSKLIACALSGKSVFCNIGWIVADNVVMTFDIFTFLIFVKMSICQFTFLVKRHWITVQSIHIKLFSQDASTGFIYNLMEEIK